MVLLAASTWQMLLRGAAGQPPAEHQRDALRFVYGDYLPAEVYASRLDFLRAAVDHYIASYRSPSDMVAIVRCPGRVNLRGMHADSHGGACNAVAIDRETCLVFSFRGQGSEADHGDTGRSDDDGTIYLSNSSAGGPQAATVETVTPAAASPSLSGWLRYVAGTRHILQQHFPAQLGTKTRGFRGSLSSDLPRGCGLSSSHALILCLMHALCLSNGLVVDRIQSLELARHIEKYAGKTTGLGDQGAMEFARAQHIVHANFYQDDLTSIVPQYARFSSAETVLVIANSREDRDLAGGKALDYAVPRFAYSIGLALLQQIMMVDFRIPAALVREFDRLSRFNPVRLARFGGSSFVYRLLLKIPAQVSPDDLCARYPQLAAAVEKARQEYLSKIPRAFQPSVVDVRGAILFGIAECNRSEIFFDELLQAEDAADERMESGASTFWRAAGCCMNIGHQGDVRSVAHAVTDAVLMDAIDREQPLHAMPGDFRASTDSLNTLQQIMSSHAACYGASLTGAGMGGCVVGLFSTTEGSCSTATAAVLEESGLRQALLEGFFKDTCGPDDLFVACAVHGTSFVPPLAFRTPYPSLSPDGPVALAAAAALQIFQEIDAERLYPTRRGAETSVAGRLRILLTGGVGFIGSHVAQALLAEGHEVVLVDDCNDYYDPSLKLAAALILTASPPFSAPGASSTAAGQASFRWLDFRDGGRLQSALSAAGRFDVAVHLGARAGVRPSVQFPALYQSTNVEATRQLFSEICSRHSPRVVFASSSSVYGAKAQGPFDEDMELSKPESPYAATKVACEELARAFASDPAAEAAGRHFIGLRFFTVDGPMLCGVPGRPDMAIASFLRSLRSSQPVTMYGTGDFMRDFSFVQDIVQGILQSLRVVVAAPATESSAKVYNLGEQDVVRVRQVILMLALDLGLVHSTGEIRSLSEEEQARLLNDLAARGLVKSVAAPPGDVPLTHASLAKAMQELGYCPSTKIEANIRQTVISTERRVVNRRLRESFRVLVNGFRHVFESGDADLLLECTEPSSPSSSSSSSSSLSSPSQRSQLRKKVALAMDVVYREGVLASPLRSQAWLEIVHVGGEVLAALD